MQTWIEQCAQERQRKTACAARYAASLRQWMQQSGTTAVALAAELGVSVSLVRHWRHPAVSGRAWRMPAMHHRDRIAELGGPAAVVAGVDGW